MELICQSLHLCNKNDGMLDLLLYETHVVVVIMCNFNYITTHFLNLVKCFGQIHHLHPQYMNSYLKTLCERNHDEVFYNKKCVNGKHCHFCGNMVLFRNKYPIDNDQSLSNVTVDWRRYEYNNYSTSSSDAHSKRIDLREDKIYV